MTGNIIPHRFGEVAAEFRSERDRAASKAKKQCNDALNEVYKFLGRFICFPSEHAHVAHALWCIHTHLMDQWDSTPRIAFLSAEKGSGKTRALEVTNLLVPNAVLAVNVSPTYLFRKVGSGNVATILYDEIDALFGPKVKGDKEDIRALLNAGHRRGAVAGRCVVKGNQVSTEEIPAYAAVALAGLGWLPDTIQSRSIIIRMQRRRPDQHVESFRERLHRNEGFKVRDAIAVWAQANAKRIAWPELPPEIQDRDADVWEPLVAIADAAGGDWPRLARRAAAVLVAYGKDVEPSLGVRLLSDIKTVFGEREVMSTRAMLAELKMLDESPWNDIRGKELDDRGLAHRLRQYEIRSRTVRIGDDTPKGYRRADFENAWASYLPPSSPTLRKSATAATAQHAADRDPPVADDVADNPSKTANEFNDVADVALVADFRGVRETDVADTASSTATEPTLTATKRCAHCGQPDFPGLRLLECWVDGQQSFGHEDCLEAAWRGWPGVVELADGNV